MSVGEQRLSSQEVSGIGSRDFSSKFQSTKGVATNSSALYADNKYTSASLSEVHQVTGDLKEILDVFLGDFYNPLPSPVYSSVPTEFIEFIPSFPSASLTSSRLDASNGVPESVNMGTHLESIVSGGTFRVEEADGKLYVGRESNDLIALDELIDDIEFKSLKVSTKFIEAYTQSVKNNSLFLSDRIESFNVLKSVAESYSAGLYQFTNCLMRGELEKFRERVDGQDPARPFSEKVRDVLQHILMVSQAINSFRETDNPSLSPTLQPRFFYRGDDLSKTLFSRLELGSVFSERGFMNTSESMEDAENCVQFEEDTVPVIFKLETLDAVSSDPFAIFLSEKGWVVMPTSYEVVSIKTKYDSDNRQLNVVECRDMNR
ncbi:hypothetical protein HOG98_07765 [bacterium]|nr:hypothetical protein [bacterium]